ncbi:uncharacterized protein M8220_015953 isoform 2-T8 [Acridotheres tristis]
MDVCVGRGCIFTSSPRRMPFSSLAFPLSPLPVLCPSWRPEWSSSSSPGCPWSAGNCRWPRALSPEELLRDAAVKNLKTAGELTGASSEKLKAKSKSSEQGAAAGRREPGRAALRGTKRPRERL